MLAGEQDTVASLLAQLEEKSRELDSRGPAEAGSREGFVEAAALEEKEKALSRALDKVRALEGEKATFATEGNRLQKKMLEAEGKYHIVAKNLKASVEDNRLLQENIDKVLKEAEDWHSKFKNSEALVQVRQATTQHIYSLASLSPLSLSSPLSGVLQETLVDQE